MSGKSVIGVAGGLLLLLSTTGSLLADDGATDRSATYAGVGWFEHGLGNEFPHGTSFGPCDNANLVDDEPPDPAIGEQTGTDTSLSDESLLEGSLDDGTLEDDALVEVAPVDDPDAQNLTIGIGGVTFCDIPQDARLHVHADDLVMPSVTGTLACYRPEFLNFWSWRTFEHETWTTPPSWCGQHANDASGTTRIVVYLNGPPVGDGAVTGEVRMSY